MGFFSNVIKGAFGKKDTIKTADYFDATGNDDILHGYIYDPKNIGKDKKVPISASRVEKNGQEIWQITYPKQYSNRNSENTQMSFVGQDRHGIIFDVTIPKLKKDGSNPVNPIQ